MTEAQKKEQTQTPEQVNLQKKAEELYKKYGTKSAVIREMNVQGHDNGPISKAMGISYQHVYNVLHQPLKGSKSSETSEKTASTKNEVAKPAPQTAKK